MCTCECIWVGEKISFFPAVSGFVTMKWACPTVGDGIWGVRWRRPTATTATTAYRGWRRRRPTSWTDCSHSRRAAAQRHSSGWCCCWCWFGCSLTSPQVLSARGSDILQSLLAPETRTTQTTLLICPQNRSFIHGKMKIHIFLKDYATKSFLSRGVLKFVCKFHKSWF